MQLFKIPFYIVAVQFGNNFQQQKVALKVTRSEGWLGPVSARVKLIPSSARLSTTKTLVTGFVSSLYLPLLGCVDKSTGISGCATSATVMASSLTCQMLVLRFTHIINAGFMMGHIACPDA